MVAAVPAGCGPRLAGGLAASLPVMLGAIVLAGYASGTRVLTQGATDLPPVPPLTAVELILAGVALLLVLPGEHRPVLHRSGRVAGGLTAAISVTVLLEYATGADLIDTVFFAEQTQSWATNGVPGRPSMHAATCLLLVGLSVIVLDTSIVRASPVGRLLVPATVLSGAMAVFGALYGAAYIRRGSDEFPGTSLVTGIGLLALGVGAALSRPDLPPGHVFTGSGPGSRAMRGLAPPVAAILISAVVLTVVGHTAFPSHAGSAVTAATCLVGTSLYLLFLRTGAAVDAADQRLRDERDYVLSVLDSLREGVVTAGVDGQILQVTPRWCEITGYAACDVVGTRPPFPWWPPGQVAAMAELMDRQLRSSAATEVDTYVLRPDGTHVEVLLTSFPIRRRDGAILRTVTYRDLTERRVVEAERQRMADQVDHFFEMSGDLLCIADRDGCFRRLNPAWERTLGWTVSELMSRPYLNFVHPEDRQSTVKVGREMIAAGTRMMSFENRFRCRDGSYRWLDWSATIADGGAVIYGVARDTTAQRDAERSQAFLAAIVKGTADAVIGTTLDGRIVSWNAAAEQMYGHLAAEAIGQPVESLDLPGEFDEIGNILAGLNAGVSPAHRDGFQRPDDGSRLRVSLTISPVHDSNGTLLGVASIARDVTAQVAAEQRFRRLIQAAPDAMIIVDGSGTITLANDQTGRLFGYPSEELIGVSVEKLVPAEARNRHARLREDYSAAPHKLLMGSGMQLSGLRRDGTEFPIEISLAPLQTDEGVMISGAIRDISQRREVEQALADARDNALAAAKLKTQFVAMVSHEIRTPMNGVIGLSGLLLGTELSAEQLRYAEAIRASGQALLSIINDILDFSKMEAKRIDLVTTDFDLVELLETVTEVAAEAGHDKSIDVICYYPPSLPQMVRGDSGRLRQTLLNLVGNAVKFTQQGHVVLHTEPSGDGTPRIAFEVIDTGVGIAGPDLPRLFEPFTQVDSATSREFGGTGLGLTISRQLVQLMGGELTVESELGAGSRFAFTIALPAVPAQNREGAPSLVSRRLLVIDEHSTRRRLVVEHARQWGMVTAEAGDEREALAALRGEPHDFVVVDDRVLATGEGLTSALVARAAGGGGHLIVLSAVSSQARLSNLPDIAGCQLTKPVGVMQLRRCLQRLCTSGAGAADAATERSRPDANKGERIRILLAEDNKVNQIVAEDLLHLLGFDCDLAQNGTEVVAMATAGPYQAILMDCQMPRMDGYEATAILRERETPGQHIPIIAMTAGAMAEDREQCFAAGMDDYIAKPIDPDVLRVALERWTGGPPAVVPSA